MGEDYFGARYYKNDMARFYSPDWSATVEPVPYAKLDNPQTLNLYTYVADNPTTLRDPDGHYLINGVAEYFNAQDRLAAFGEQLGNSGSLAAGMIAIASNNADAQLKAVAEEAQNQSYTATILGQKVPVSIVGGTADAQKAIRGRLDAAFADINGHAGDLSASDVKTIHNIKSISVDDSSRTGVDVKTGAYNLKPGYVMAEGSTTAWIASTIGHDAYHVTQFQQGEVYNRQTAPRLERDANQFQIRVGSTFGLTQSQIDYIRNDTHTLYNTPPY